MFPQAFRHGFERTLEVRRQKSASLDRTTLPFDGTAAWSSGVSPLAAHARAAPAAASRTEPGNERHRPVFALAQASLSWRSAPRMPSPERTLMTAFAILAVASANAAAAVGVWRPCQRRTRTTTAHGHAAAERSHAAGHAGAARSRRTPPRGEHDGAQGADSRPPGRRAGNRRRMHDAGGRGANEGHLTPFPVGETSKSSDCRGLAHRGHRLSSRFLDFAVGGPLKFVR